MNKSLPCVNHEGLTLVDEGLVVPDEQIRHNLRVVLGIPIQLHHLILILQPEQPNRSAEATRAAEQDEDEQLLLGCRLGEAAELLVRNDEFGLRSDTLGVDRSHDCLAHTGAEEGNELREEAMRGAMP